MATDEELPGKGNVEALLKAAERFGAVTEVTAKDLETQRALVLPKGLHIESLLPTIEAFRERPIRRRGTANILTLASFIDHVRRFKSQDSVVFVEYAKMTGRLLAVFDYNPGGPSSSMANYGEHRAQYSFPLSQEWAAWAGSSDKWLTQ